MFESQAVVIDSAPVGQGGVELVHKERANRCYEYDRAMEICGAGYDCQYSSTMSFGNQP